MIQKDIKPLNEAKGGFRQNRFALDQIFVLHIIIEEQIIKKQPCYQAFLDIKRTYDSVQRDILWTKWEYKNIVGQKPKLLESMSDRTEVAVRISYKEIKYVRIGVGLLQGLLLSLLLFNVFIDDPPKFLISNNEGFNIGNTKVNFIIYVDDSSHIKK